MMEWLRKWSRHLAVRPIQRADKRNECCRLEENLGASEPTEPGRTDSSFRRCRVCGCRHFTFEIDAGKIGVVGGKLGVVE